MIVSQLERIPDHSLGAVCPNVGNSPEKLALSSQDGRKTACRFRGMRKSKQPVQVPMDGLCFAEWAGLEPTFPCLPGRIIEAATPD